MSICNAGCSTLNAFTSKRFAVDYEPFAAVRVVTGCDAVINVGFRRTRVYGCHAESARPSSTSAAVAKT